MKKIKIVILLFLTAAAALGGSAYFYIQNSANSHLGFDEDKIFVLNRGGSFGDFLDFAASNNPDLNTTALKIWARLNKVQHLLKAGTYLIEKDMRFQDAVNKIINGKEHYQTLRIIEGLNLKQTAAEIEKQLGLSALKILKLSSNPEFINQISSYNISTLEGFLFPSTYFFPFNASEEDILKKMHNEFKLKLEEIKKSRTTFLNDRSAVILASIIEKEAAVEKEKAVISSVFHNRLKINMPLQSCATVLYALDKPLSRLLYTDLKVKSPYNTYIHPGLPPAPISLPSYGAIRAAFIPAETNYLYFVSKGDGTHHFSASFSEHNTAKQKYVQGRR